MGTAHETVTGACAKPAVAGASAHDLTRRLATEMALTNARGSGGSLSHLVQAVSEAIGSVVYLLDPDERVVARAVPEACTATSIPRLARLRAADPVQVSPDGVTLVEALPCGGTSRRHRVAPVILDGTVLAWLVAGESEAGAAADEAWIVERALVHVRAEYTAQRRLARVAWNARSNLGRQMIRSSSYDEDLRSCAEYLGVDLSADRVIVFVLERGRSSSSTVDAARLAELVSADLRLEVLPIRGSEGVLLAIAVPRDTDHVVLVSGIKKAVVAGLQTMGDQFAIAGVSSVTRAGQLRRAYREAREVARCIDRYAGADTRAVGCDELGPARLFVANSDEHSVRLYVHDVLGPLLSGGSTMAELMKTLTAYFEGGRSIRETATLLQVHENTVRHRLGRVHELTGLDVASGSQDQLSVHTALLVLRLQGHHAVPAFDLAR